jgi:chromosome partitioning protein
LQNLDDLEMDLLGKWLLKPAGYDIRYLLRAALHSDVIQERYDYVLIDCPPRLTTACINALAASDYILIPAQAEQVSAGSVYHLLRRLRPLREGGVIPDLKVLGIVGNMVSAEAHQANSREAKLLRQLEAPASDHWGNKVRLLKARIRYSDYYAKYNRDAYEKGHVQLPVIAVEAIREQYEKLTKEIEGYIHEDLGAT